MVSGGTSTYSYLWSNGTNTLPNLTILAGAYTFTVTDLNGCKASASALVNDIAGPTVVITSTTAVKCFGGNDGAATSTITGGVGTYTIAWNNNPSTSQNVTNFNAGLHNITVTDGAGCVGTASINITQPTALASAINTHTDVTCFGFTNGQALMQVTGGTTAYTYSWTPSAQTSSVMANVGAGTYTCNVKDANNCPTSQVVLISGPSASLTITSSVTDISCFGGNNGQISTNVQGGTPGYTYSWTPTQTNSGVVGGLSAGTYSLNLRDANNCPLTANFSILEPSVLTSSYTSTPAKCGALNGTATMTVGGGAPSYTLNWNAAAQQGSTATNMGPGNYNCVITDSHGCIKTQTVVVANAPGPQNISVTSSTPTCFGLSNASVTVNYTSGTPGYTVTWSSPINPPVQTTSALSATAVNVGTGSYNVTVTDLYGCSISSPVNVAAVFPTLLSVSAPQTICYGQSAQISANGSGGRYPNAYTYIWTPTAFTGGGPITVSPMVTTNYNVNMTDMYGCTAAPQVVIVNVTPPLLITGKTYTICDGYGVDLVPNIISPGSSPTYTFTWSNGITDAGVPNSTLTVIASATAATNNYTVNISDGCSTTPAPATFTVFVNQLPTVNFTGGTNGCAPWPVTLTGTTNATSSSFLWNSGTNTGTTSPTWSTTYNDSGKYSVSLTVTDLITRCFNTKPAKDYITVYPKPHAAFTPNPQSTSILDPLISFTNTSQGAATYL